MPVDSPEFIDSAIKVYNVEVHRAIKAQEEQLLRLQTAHEQLQQNIETLAELPNRLRHPAMIPLGKHAFFRGHLTRTNEVMVHLGEQYYVETSAAVARGILQRRLDVLAQGVSKAQQQLQALRARLDVTQSSLRDDSADGGAFEIRSSIEESDALLASAASKRKQAAARQQQQQQQRQGLVSRVRTAGGYSYTPIGLPEGQQQQEQDPDAAALQARLEELIRLEEQQEADQQDAPWDHQQQQQQQQLASIQEGEEEDGDDDVSTAAGTSVARLPAAAGNAGLHAAAQHLQQLEEQADSDDDDAVQHQHHQKQQQQQQQQQQQSDGVLSRVVERTPNAPQQQERQQPKAPAAGAPAAGAPAAGGGAGAGTASVPGRPPLKSALKKGFLTSSSKAGSGSSSSSDSSTSRWRGTSSSSSGSSSTVQKSSVSAFTGAVVERPAPAVDASPPAIVERVPVAAQAPDSTSSSTTSRPSKFKLRRMGIEPSD
jgi:prefoldin alpha subunit